MMPCYVAIGADPAMGVYSNRTLGKPKKDFPEGP